MGVFPSKYLRPPFLKQGDTVALVAPAGHIESGIVALATTIFESWGLQVEVGRHVASSSGYFAGSDVDRASDLQHMIEQPHVRAIVCLRGGYGSIRTLMNLNCIPLRKDPKWLVGFSDITVFHSYLNAQIGIESIHSCMPISFAKEDEHSKESIQSLRRALFGELSEYKLYPHALNVKGHAEGRLIGGNLSTLLSVAGTPFDITTDGAILFIEDLNECLYHIDRMVMNLLASRKLSRLAGVLVGSFTNCKDSEPPFGKDVYQLIVDHVRPLGIPVAVGMPAGHQEENMAMYFGRKVELKVAAKKVLLRFE